MNNSDTFKERTVENIIDSLQIPITDIVVKHAFVSLDELGTFQLLLRGEQIGTLPYQNGFFGRPMFYSTLAKIDWNKIFELEKEQIKKSVAALIESDHIEISPSAFINAVEVQLETKAIIVFCYFRNGSWKSSKL